MPDDFDDDDVIGEPDEEDPNNLEELVGMEMAIEVNEICERARRLLGADVEGGYGAPELQRVCLDIPKGLLLVAQYCVGREHYGQDWPWMRAALKDKGMQGRDARAAVHDRLAKYLKDALHEELRCLGTGEHRILRAELERRGWGTIRPEKPRPEPPANKSASAGELEDEEPTFAELVGEEMAAEVKEVVDRSHKLLGNEMLGGRGAPKLERVCLDIPKGLLLVAQYCVGREHYNQEWPWMREALKGKGREGRSVRAVVHERLTLYLKDALHDELHWLATHGHRILRAEMERRGSGTIKGDGG